MLKSASIALLSCFLAQAAVAQTISAAPPLPAPIQPTDKMFIFRGNVPVYSTDMATLFGGGLPTTIARHVPDNATLKLALTATFAQGVWRDDYAAGNGAPPLFYTPSAAPCTLNAGAGDNGSQVSSGDGKCWLAQFPSATVDIREWGAKPDNSTPADTPVASAIAYVGANGGCVYAPAVTPGFTFNSAINITGNTGCFVGTSLAYINGETEVPTLHFPNDTDGIVIGPVGPGWYVANLNIVGNAAVSLVATHTNGLHVKKYEGKVENLWIQNFAVCKYLTGPSGRVDIRDVHCQDQDYYPNLVNDFPYVCTLMAIGSDGSDYPAGSDTGGECRAQGGQVRALYTASGTSGTFDISKPSTYLPLWRADGVKVRFGHGAVPASSDPLTHLPNGQNIYDGQIQAPGVGYTIWDCGATPCGGSGGTQLFLTQTALTVTSGLTAATVADTTGYPSGTNILVVADHGLAPATKLSAVVNGTTITLSKPALVTGTLTATITQENIKAVSSGQNIEVRFASGLTNGQAVTLEWLDPTGYVAYDAEAVSDYIFIRPTLVGGYDKILKYVGDSDGGVELRPTYMEINNQCVDIEKASANTVFNARRIVNAPPPNCPGYIDPNSYRSLVSFNNRRYTVGGAGDPLHPGYVSGNWYDPLSTIMVGSGTAVAAADTAYCEPMGIGQPFTATTLAANVTAAGTGASVEYAIYDTDPATARPGILLAASAAVSISGTGSKAGAIAKPLYLPAGLYWACSLWTWSGAPSAAQLINFDGDVNVGQAAWMVGNSTSNTLIGTSQGTGASYQHSGLFASGFPDKLTGLTSDTGSTAVPWLTWEQQ